MKIEVLFPDLCNLYGDNGNVQYLAASLPEAEMVFTGNLETPRFTKEPVDLIYLGSMSEAGQELAIQRLLPHRQALRQYVESGKVLLATGNALELFGAYIQDGTRKIPTLGLFPCHAVRDMERRHNSMFLGTRLLLAGVPAEKLVCLRQELDTADYVDFHGVEKIYILHDVNAISRGRQVRDLVKARILAERGESHEN